MEGKKGGVREGSGVTGQRKEKVCGEEICQVKRHFSKLFHPVSLKKKEIAARPTGSRGKKKMRKQFQRETARKAGEGFFFIYYLLLFWWV